MPSTEAWARCATEKASLTKMSPSAASCATKAGSLRSSPGWKRVFSRHRMSPGFMAFTAAAARSPMQSSANATGRSRTAAIAGANGLSDCAGSGPFGRPKWESRITLPPLSAISRMVGAARSMRVASATLPFSTGTLRSTRTSTRFRSEMGEQDHLAALVCNLADGRSRPLDAGRVRDLAVFDRHVEIDTHEYAFAPHVGLIEGAEHISGLRAWSCERKPPQRDARSSPAGQISFPIATAVSTIRLEKPHSLSYHDITRTSVPSITLVWSMANTDECASWLKSLETLGASV